MRYLKLFALTALSLVLLLAAWPALADDPFGGPPSATSGNGATTWQAIYVGNDGCWTGSLAAGGSLWFKADTWPVNLDGVPVTLLVWLDDELPGAIRPSGSAVLRTAYNYFVGTPDDFDTAYRLGDQEAPYVNGFAFRVFDPDALAPNFYYPTPNMWLLTTSNGTAINGSVAPEGWGTHNASGAPNHLLWYEGGSWSGWAYVQVYNQMVQAGTFSICTQKHLRFDRYQTPTPTDPSAPPTVSNPSSPITASLMLRPIAGVITPTVASATDVSGTRSLAPLAGTPTPTPESTRAAAASSDQTSVPGPTVAATEPASAAGSSPTPSDQESAAGEPSQTAGPQPATLQATTAPSSAGSTTAATSSAGQTPVASPVSGDPAPAQPTAEQPASASPAASGSLTADSPASSAEPAPVKPTSASAAAPSLQTTSNGDGTTSGPSAAPSSAPAPAQPPAAATSAPPPPPPPPPAPRPTPTTVQN